MSIDNLRNFINDNCIVRAPPGYYLQGTSPEEQYDWQFYLRRAIFDQESLFTISRWLLNAPHDGVQYAAMETAGPPMLAGLKLLGHYTGQQIDGFAIRKDQKKYGLLNWIEGSVNLSKPVIILDDMANSKSTIVRAKEISEAHGLEVIGAKTIVNKKDSHDVDGIPVQSIFKISDFELCWWEYYDNKREEPNIEGYLAGHGKAFLKR